MMKYKGYYWTVLSPLIKKSVKNRYGAEMADKAFTEGKKQYRTLLSRADDLGPGNPMEENAYFAYVFVAAWLGTGKKITPQGMSEVMQDVLHVMRPFFRMSANINTKKGSKMWYNKMKKYEAWCDKNFDKYPTTWKVGFDEKLHEDGSYYYFTQCPVCSFCQREGIPEIMGPLCGTDWLMFRMQRGVLHREHTLANGEGICDYWVVGDEVKNPR